MYHTIYIKSLLVVKFDHIIFYEYNVFFSKNYFVFLIILYGITLAGTPYYVA